MDTQKILLLPNEKLAVSEILPRTLFSRKGPAYGENLASLATKESLGSRKSFVHQRTERQLKLKQDAIPALPLRQIFKCSKLPCFDGK